MFAEELDEAAGLFRAIQPVNGGRVGCQMALKAVIDFCDRAGLREQRQPLMQLFSALESAEKGSTDPLLKAAPLKGAPPLTEAERRQRGCVAAAMEAMIRGGMTPDDAAKWVARRAHKLAAFRPSPTPLWKVVKSWRVIARGGSKTDDWDAVAYWAACGMLDTGIGVGVQGAEVLLKLAAREGKVQESPPLP